MKQKSLITRWLLMLIALLPLSVAAQSTQLAKWTFDSGYDVASNVYTPNTSDWAQVGWNGFSNTFKVLPNENVGEASSYYVSAKGTRFWGIMDNNGDKIMSLYQDMDPNNITDYTDASQHNQYFEIAFPTTGYKNISVNFAFTCGDNVARNLEMVVSTDGGETWADAGAYTGAAYWWIYNTNNAPISANNKESVIVRLIAENGATAQWRMNEISITGEEAEAAQVVDEKDVTVKWQFNAAGDSEHSATVSVENMVTGSDFELSDKLYFNGTQTVGGVTMSKINPYAKANAEDAEAYLKFTLKPKKGLTFLPKKLSFDATKCGTSGGNFTIYAVSGNQKVTVVSGYNPPTSNALDQKEYDITGIDASSESFDIYMHIWNLNDNKQVGLANVVITGDFEGTIQPTPSYTMSLQLGTEGAGQVSCSPAGSEFDEGTELTVKATENIGYHFKEWQDAEGQKVSAANPYKFEITANTALTAVYDAVPVYTVTTKVKTDIDKTIGSVTLSPNANNNKYEEGDDITATAGTSKILTFTNWEDGTTANPRAITVDKDMTITANYEVQDFIAVFDDSTVGDVYDYSGTGFAADLSWDESRNAKASIVKVSDGTAVYTQTGGTPVVRCRSNVVVNNLGGMYQNGYDTRDIAWQYQFSTKKFTDVKFVGQMAAKNAATKSYKAQYSLDGTTFTDIDGATLTMSSPNIITDYNFDLPAGCNDQEIVYVRITGTGEDVFDPARQVVAGQFLGLDYYANSESGVGNVFILATAEVEEDSDAPQVVSTIPAANATGVSASGKITITYDERIKAGSVVGAVATLNGQPLEAVFNTRSVTFDYAGLSYGATCTFSMPAGYVEDRSGNAAEEYTFSFTVMDRQKPAARTFNAIVDASLELGQGEKIDATDDMPAQYRYLQDAINAAPDVNAKPYLIYVKEGYYNDPNPYFTSGYGFVYKDQTPGSASEETIKIKGNGYSEDGTIKYDDCRLIYVNKPNIHIIGQAVDKVTIATDRQDGGDKGNRSKAWYHVNAGAALEVQQGANDFYMENITIDNENWTLDHKAGPQALCINADADRVAWNNMNIRSYQDDFYSHGVYNRYFWNNSRIEGSVDFIYGNGDIWFENITLDINRSAGGYIVAPNHELETRWGYVFNNTKIVSSLYGESCQVWLGRPWHNYPKTVFINSEMDIKPYALYWAEEMGGLPALWAVYNMTDKNGTTMTSESRLTYKAKATASTFAEGTYDSRTEDPVGKDSSGNDLYYFSKNAKNSLTAEEAAAYTMDNVLAGDGTSDGNTGKWNPLPLVEKTSTPQPVVNGNIATWDADEYAICYVVTVNGKPTAFPTEASYVGEEGQEVSVQSVNEYGALSEMSYSVTLQAATAVKAVGENAGNENFSAEKIMTKDGVRIGNFNIAGQRVK